MSALRRVLSSAGLVATAASACGASQPANVPPPQCYGPGLASKGISIASSGNASLRVRDRRGIVGPFWGRPSSESAWQAV